MQKIRGGLEKLRGGDYMKGEQSDYEKSKMRGYSVIKIKTRDVKRLDKLKVHITEPKWAVVERLLDRAGDREDENLLVPGRNVGGKQKVILR
jgi:hypothetical protein